MISALAASLPPGLSVSQPMDVAETLSLRFSIVNLLSPLFSLTVGQLNALQNQDHLNPTPRMVL